MEAFLFAAYKQTPTDLSDDLVQLVHLRPVEGFPGTSVDPGAVHHALVQEQAVHVVTGVVVLLDVLPAA